MLGINDSLNTNKAYGTFNNQIFSEPNTPISNASDFSDFTYQIGNSYDEQYSNVSWVVIRTLPPDDMMPSYEFGKMERANIVTFTENGIENGIPWYVNISGNISPSSGLIYGANYSFYLPNGRYTYSVGSIFYFPNMSEGVIRINGTSINISVNFQKYATIKALVTPWSSSAAIGGNKISYSGWIYNKSGFLVSGTFNLTMRPGNYTIIIEDNGHRTFHENISLSSGELLFLNVTLPPLKSNIISPIVLSSFVVAAVAIALIALILYMRHRRRKR